MSGGGVPGGKSSARPVSDETKQLVLQQRAAIASAAGVESFDVFEPVSERSQVVAGTNHYVKIRVGSDAYAHAVIWVHHACSPLTQRRCSRRRLSAAVPPLTCAPLPLPRAPPSQTKPWEQFVQVTKVETGKTEEDPL